MVPETCSGKLAIHGVGDDGGANFGGRGLQLGGVGRDCHAFRNGAHLHGDIQRNSGPGRHCNAFLSELLQIGRLDCDGVTTGREVGERIDSSLGGSGGLREARIHVASRDTGADAEHTATGVGDHAFDAAVGGLRMERNCSRQYKGMQKYK